MACGIPRVTISLFKPLQMQIGKEVLMIVRVLVEQHSILVIVSYHGWAKRKSQSRYLQRKQNTLQRQHVVLKSFGWNKLCKIFKYNSMSLFPYSVTTPVPSTSPRILSCIKKQNTFRSNIILLENKLLKRISNLSMFVQKNKLLIYSLNLYLVKHLNIFSWSFTFSQVLITFSLFGK